MKRRLGIGIVAAALVAALSGPAVAAPIRFDFSTIGGLNGDPFTSATQNGITVSPATGTWLKTHLVGNPAPSIFSFHRNASIDIGTGGLFQFISFDLGIGASSNPLFSFTGYLNNIAQFNGSGGFPENAFTTINNLNSTLVDRVVIQITRTTTGAVNIDNIWVDTSPIPEPATLLLLGTGLAAVAVRRRLAKRT